MSGPKGPLMIQGPAEGGWAGRDASKTGDRSCSARDIMARASSRVENVFK
jgi:hypothetical protein